MDNRNMNPEGTHHPDDGNKKHKWWDDLIPGRSDRNLFKEGEDEAPIDQDRKFASNDPYTADGDENYDDETLLNREGEKGSQKDYFEKRDDQDKVRK